MTTTAPSTPKADLVRQGSIAPKRFRWRTHGWLLALLAIAVLIGLAVTARSDVRDPLDPANTHGEGSAALAGVLEEHGIEVHVARGPDALEQAQPGSGTTVLVSQTDLLSENSTRHLTATAADADRIVAIAPDAAATSWLAPSAEAVPTPGGFPISSTCSDPAVRDGEALTGVTTLYGSPDATVTCLVGEGITTSMGSDAGAYLQVPGAAGTPTILLGSRRMASNDGVVEGANAAVLARATGASPQVVWYVPSWDDEVSQGEAVLPPWIGPVVLLTAALVVITMFWRGRRLGPLVTEPLPVVVPSNESTHMRARLYTRTRDRAHAVGALRAAAMRRLRHRLTLGHDAPPLAIAQAIAARTGRDPAAVMQVLVEAPATTNAEMIELAQQLATIENEVRAT